MILFSEIQFRRNKKMESFIPVQKLSESRYMDYYINELDNGHVEIRLINPPAEDGSRLVSDTRVEVDGKHEFEKSNVNVQKIIMMQKIDSMLSGIEKFEGNYNYIINPNIFDTSAGNVLNSMKLGNIDLKQTVEKLKKIFHTSFLESGDGLNFKYQKSFFDYLALKQRCDNGLKSLINQADILLGNKPEEKLYNNKVDWQEECSGVTLELARKSKG
jgi:hypothetical protein